MDIIRKQCEIDKYHKWTKVTVNSGSDDMICEFCGIHCLSNRIDSTLRNDTAKHYKEVHNEVNKLKYPKLLHSNIPMSDCDDMASEIYTMKQWDNVCNIVWLVALGAVITIVILWSGVAHAEDISGYPIDKWAYSIKMAENSYKHPYGIMTVYRHTTARQACINTIRHNWRNYSKLTLQTRQAEGFTHYLARHYAPVNCNTDNGTNQFWAKNVNWYLKKG